MSTAILGKNQAFARCPNGTHMSPSGDCEAVVAHTGLPRCLNGFHRSPSGTCEQVELQGVNGSSSVSDLNTTGGPLINSANTNNVSRIFANSTNASNMTVRSFNASQSSTSPSAMNQTLDQQCDWSVHLSCFSVGFKAGRSAPGTSCPSGYSFTFCEGYHIGSGRDIVDRGAHGGETDVGNAISFYLHHFPTSMGILKTATNTTITSSIPKLNPSNTTSATNTTAGTKVPSAVPSKIF